MGEVTLVAPIRPSQPKQDSLKDEGLCNALSHLLAGEGWVTLPLYLLPHFCSSQTAHESGVLGCSNIWRFLRILVHLSVHTFRQLQQQLWFWRVLISQSLNIPACLVHSSICGMINLQIPSVADRDIYFFSCSKNGKILLTLLLSQVFQFKSMIYVYIETLIL